MWENFAPEIWRMNCFSCLPLWKEKGRIQFQVKGANDFAS